MIKIKADIVEADLLKLEQAIGLMVRHTNKGLKQAVEKASIAFLVSARANTPIAKGKNRKVRGGSNMRFYAVHRQKQGLMRIILPQGQKKAAIARRRELAAKWKKKPNVGASKNSWSRAFSDVGKAAKKQVGLRGRAKAAASRAKKLGGHFTPTINITNTWSALDQMISVPWLEREAMGRAGKKLLDGVEKQIAKSARRWK